MRLGSRGTLHDAAGYLQRVIAAPTSSVLRTEQQHAGVACLALLVQQHQRAQLSTWDALGRRDATGGSASTALPVLQRQQLRWKHTGEKPLFDKILVANRGEIALRVMRTAKRMGIKTVAVYSEADRDSLHVRYADEAVCIGPPASTKSYLNVDAIMEAIQSTGAQAVHPGYGFLSENSSFAKRLAEAGVEFVGPPQRAVAAMGDKVESKRLAKAAGVNTIPGFIGEVRDEDHAVQLAQEIGFPAMIKASAGGGGKGMRVVRNEDEVREGFQLCVQEAAASFGDSRMLIERFIEEPRHIEIQLLGDKHGTVLWLPERECSIQRRNQKVVEEAPSPFATPELRWAMGEQAVSLAQAVGYYSAGTLEFLVDKHRNFYFLEMNTRLQVEHPITEYITQLDLVEQMIRVAAGQKLSFSQEQASRVHGWAVECRVYAEDPSKGFLPSIGRLTRYVEPRGMEVRVDSGVAEGSEISMYYDPMISKLVTGGADRKQALARMERALDSYVIRGVANNAQLLRSVVSHPEFVAGNTNTAFLPEHFPQVFETPQQRHGAPFNLPLTHQQRTVMVVVAAFQAAHREAGMSGRTVPQLMEQQAGGVLELVVGVEGANHPVSIRPATAQLASTEDVAAGALQVEAAGRSHLVTLAPPPSPEAGTAAPRPLPYCPEVLRYSVDGELHICQLVSRQPRGLTLQYAGAERQLTVQCADLAHLEQYMPPPVTSASQNVLASPMAGTLISVSVQVGEEVLPGDDLAVVEAMKMRNVLKAVAPARVKAIKARAGDVMRADQVILELEEVEAAAEATAGK